MTTKASNTPDVVFGGLINTATGAMTGQGRGIKLITRNGAGDVTIDLQPDCSFADGELAIIAQSRDGVAATPFFPPVITRVDADTIRVKFFAYTAAATIPAATDCTFYLEAHRILPAQRPT